MTNLSDEARDLYRREAALFREYNARRERRPGACEWCGEPTPPSYTTRRFCSQRCQKRAYRQRIDGTVDGKAAAN
jgi:hypothetical protein